QCDNQAEGVSLLLGQSEHLLNSLRGLVRIAKQPQGSSCVASTTYPGVKPIEKSMGAVLLGIIESDPLLKVFSRWSHLSEPVQGYPHRVMRFQEARGALHAL